MHLLDQIFFLKYLFERRFLIETLFTDAQTDAHIMVKPI